MYREPFAVPAPDQIVFLSRFKGGVFRSGGTWKRGSKIFYFRSGQETDPIYFHPTVRQVLRNALHWGAPEGQAWIDRCRTSRLAKPTRS